MKYYKCTRDLYSIFKKMLFNEDLLKFSKDKIYECIGEDVYINNQGDQDFIAIEGWEKYFVPIDLDEVNISELDEFLCEKVLTKKNI